MAHTSPTAGMSPVSTRWFLLLVVAVLVLIAAVAIFALGTFTESAQPSAVLRAELSSDWSDAGARVAGLAASARPGARDAGAAVPSGQRAHVQLLSVVPAPLAMATFRDAGASGLTVAQLAAASGRLAGTSWSDAGTRLRLLAALSTDWSDVGTAHP